MTPAYPPRLLLAMSCDCSSSADIVNTTKNGKVRIVPFHEAEYASVLTSLAAAAPAFQQLQADQLSQFLFSDGKEVGYGTSATIQGADGVSSRIYGIKKAGDFIAFQIRAVLIPPLKIRISLEITEPIQRSWSVDVDIATSQIVGGNTQRDANLAGNIKLLDWSDCVWDCLKKEAPGCVLCLADPDCWIVCAGTKVAGCAWDCW